MKNLSTFQLITLVVFAGSAAAGIFAFATYKSTDSGGGPQTLSVEVWGTLPQSQLGAYFSELYRTSNQAVSVKYTEKKEGEIAGDLVEAIADGSSPDLLLIPDSLLLSVARRAAPIPYETLTQRVFLDTYVQSAESYLGPDGVYGVPVAIDPLMMYWNRDHLQSAGIAKPPSEWSALPGLAETLTRRDDSLNIQRSGIAMGEYENVRNAKEIFLTLLLQAGNPIVSNVSGRLEASLGGSDDAVAGLEYFAQFSNPLLSVYSWNRSLPDSRDAFASDRLSIYFGHASELFAIRSLNPNLNFDVAPVPQRRGTDFRTTLARAYALVPLRTSRQVPVAVGAALALGDPSIAGAIAYAVNLSPARRDLLSEPIEDPFLTSVDRSAVISRSWLDPDPAASDEVFGRMVGWTISGAKDPTDAVERADRELDQLLSGARYR